MRNKRREPMPVSERAKQFMPFAAVKGLEEALAAKEKKKVPKRELSEEMIQKLDETLQRVQIGSLITVVYYDNEEYLQLTGILARLDVYHGYLQVVTTKIRFEDVYELLIEDEKKIEEEM